MKIGNCVHFTGMQNKTCDADVLYSDMRDVSAPGIAHWPCLPSMHKRPCATTCPKFRAMTPEECEAEEKELTRLCMEALKGNCPDCGKQMERKDFPGGYVLVCETHGERFRECTPKEHP